MRKLMSVYNGTFSLLVLMFLVTASVSNAQVIEFAAENDSKSEG